MLDSLNKEVLEHYRKLIIRKDFCCNTKVLVIKFEFCAEISDEKHRVQVLHDILLSKCFCL